MTQGLRKIIFVNTHPIQYFAPLYTFCNKNGLNVEVWYCSDESIRGEKDVQFGKAIRWDIPLLEGYPYRFFNNHSWKPSINKGFFGVINFGIIKALCNEPKSIVIIHGWGHLSQLIAIFFGKIMGHKICLRGETPLKQEKTAGLKNQVRKVFLKTMFTCVDKFIYIGKENFSFYQHYGVAKEDLVFAPYAVDNDRFQKSFCELNPHKNTIKKELSIPLDHFVIIYSGKYISKKRPLDVIKAFALMNNTQVSLVMIGEGELRVEMERFVSENHLKNVYLTGFINQSVIPKYYAVGDAFVMCSQEGETWGLSVNEAMNFALPIVVSDMVGCSEDLVEVGQNGYTYKCGNVHELSQILNKLTLDTCYTSKLGQRSKEKIKNFSFQVIKDNIQTLL